MLTIETSLELHRHLAAHMLVLSTLYSKANVANTEMKVELAYISNAGVIIPIEREIELATLAMEMLVWEHIVQFLFLVKRKH
jgi:hypothetical protein